ncbi:MAG: nickel-dependent lactate racemase [Thermodesulfobacteriota bacterium]
MDKLFVRYGDEKWYFDPPPGWNVLTFASFQDRPHEPDVEELTRNALNNPVRSAPLRERVSPSDTVAIIIEDQTRASPKKIILKALLEELQQIGVPARNISMIVALGTHRALTTGEMETVYGEDAVRGYSFTNHDCQAPDLVPVGRLKTGAVVKVNRRVHEATFRIGIGSIFPHVLNGFGGGGKILFPGVVNFDAILEHHLKYSFRNGSELGRLKGNPFHDEVCALSEKAGLHFIINGVLNHNDLLHAIVAGDPIDAHLSGVELCKGVISQAFPRKSDVTLISSFPYTEGPQIVKPFGPAALVTREGGVIILAARCTLALPEIYLEGCERFRTRHKGRLREGVFSLFDRNRRIIEDGAPELNMSAAQVLLTQDRCRVILVSKDISRQTAERLGFLFAGDLKEAFAISGRLIPNPEVHVIPAGGVILPQLQG